MPPVSHPDPALAVPAADPFPGAASKLSQLARWATTGRIPECLAAGWACGMVGAALPPSLLVRYGVLGKEATAADAERVNRERHSTLRSYLAGRADFDYESATAVPTAPPNPTADVIVRGPQPAFLVAAGRRRATIQRADGTQNLESLPGRPFEAADLGRILHHSGRLFWLLHNQAKRFRQPFFLFSALRELRDTHGVIRTSWLTRMPRLHGGSESKRSAPFVRQVFVDTSFPLDANDRAAVIRRSLQALIRT